MALVYRRCAGLDIHRDTVVACIRIRVASGKHEEKKETGEFMAWIIADRRIDLSGA